jgi:ADP-L-glycero-D-manno-heptose 6-epimerase
MGREPNISFIDMPEHLQGKYQYHTQADLVKLRAAGYDAEFIPVEDGVADYVQNYLMKA